MRNQIVTVRRGTVSPGERTQVFYAAPAPIAGVLCALLLLAMGAMYGLLFFSVPGEEARAVLHQLLPLIGIGLLGEIGAAFLISRLSPIRIHESGITITEFWGRKRTLTWGEIETVSLGNCLSLPFLKLSSFRADHATPLIIPLAVTRRQELVDSLRHFASPINPVRRYLEGDASI